MKFTFAPESRPLEGYTIKRAIYRGGFGEVYYALTDAGREVALKLLQNNTDVELRGVQQCLNLSHPNLVTIFDIRRDAEGDHWILMEYVAGETLDTALRRHPSGMPMEEVRRWLPGLAAGVGFLHDRGIVHRDLKPGNVFIENGVVKVGDVGLSKFITPSRRSAHTQSVGTVYYMAPEVAKGKYGKEVDIYAIGVILYEMLTGRVPFDGESTGEILMKHLSQPPDLSLLPPRLQPVIGKALEKDPARRYVSVAALAEAFECAVLGRPTVLEIPESAFAAASARGTPVRCRVRRTRPSPDGQRPRHRCGMPAALARSNMWLLLGLLGLLLAPFAGGPLIGLLSLLSVSYGAYRSVLDYSVSTQPESGGAAARPVPAAVAAAPPPPVVVPAPSPFVKQPGEAGPHCRRRRPDPRTIRALSVRERLASFTESGAMAAVLTVVFTTGLAVTGFFAPTRASGLVSSSELGPIDPALVGLFAATALFAAWAIMAVSKLLEGRGVAPFSRRLILLLVGCLIGEVAWGLDEFLFVQFTERGDGLMTAINSVPLADAGGPTWLGYIMFFGPLLAVRRWWWHADSYRLRRFSVMSLLLTMLCAFLLSTIWQFPQTWAILWAAVLSSVVQLSSAWTPPQARIAR